MGVENFKVMSKSISGSNSDDNSVVFSTFINMVKPVYTAQISNFTLLCILLLFSGFQPAPKTIVLHNDQLLFTPKEFYVADVTDEREYRTAIARLLSEGTEAINSKIYTVDFQGGGFAAVKQFVNHSVPRNITLRPVIIKIKKIMATESSLEGGRVQGDIEFDLSFYLKNGDDDAVHLANYHGGSHYNRMAGPPQAIEPLMRNVLKEGLIYLNNWIDQQSGTNIKLAKGVKVLFTDYKENNEEDTIYYSVKRPLTWDDFKSPVPISKYDAEAFPGFGYEEHAVVANGIIKINLVMKVYLPKSASWVKNDSRTDYALNHEQRHFDIVKIIAERFKNKVSSENLPVNNFEGPVNEDYLESYREMNSLQKQYDKETNHGADQTAQQRWNERIDRELKAFSVK